ncbi:aminotransferase class I/II-fold pyridoxal phosphate-dependent enzyme [Flavicella sp.]|uniref:aminotransferase class I/II-fold pyridoxal phosphate-dependent enzyme n=1 Tax=Flavicella sp. TaxID=2957742 RepID=UPI00301B124A
MKNHIIKLSEQLLQGNELKYIKKAISLNEIGPKGEFLDSFENRISAYVGSKSCLALSSGTAAIHLALQVLGVQKGDTVLCSSFTFAASAFPIQYIGAQPVFIDCEPISWNMCPDLLLKAIKKEILLRKKPKAIIVVHSYGMPAQMNKILEIANRYKIPVLEDSAAALGSSYRGEMCGSMGSIGVFSFNANKIITTGGGGALISNNNEYFKKATFLATNAKDKAPYYQHSEIGYNCGMSNLVAGIGLGQLEVLERYITLRREMNAFYKEIFLNVEGITVFKEPNSDYYSNHWLTCITIDKSKTNITADQIRLALEEEGIESRPLWKPMHLQPVFKSASYYGGKVSEDLFKSGLCLPSGSNIQQEGRNRIEAVLKRLFGV